LQNKRFEKSLVFVAIALVFGVGAYFQTKAPNISSENQAKIVFFDVGQGDASLIMTPHRKKILIDGGPDKSILSELSTQMLPTDRRIDTLVLTHPHADHVVGLDYVLDRYEIGEVYLTGAVHTAPDYLEFLDKIREKNIPAKKAYAGQSFELDGAKFRFLYPKNDISGLEPKDQNDGSIILDVEIWGQKYLFLADLSAKLQEENLMDGSIVGPYNIMKVSHHGSKTGTSNKILDQVRPKYAIITVGAANRYGLPATRTLAQLSAYPTLRTDRDGTIEFNISPNSFTLK